MIKNALAVFCILCFYCCTFAQQRPLYNINVTLNHKDRSIDGFLNVVYTNNSTDTVNFLWFNIYPNAFKSDRTAFSEYLLTKRRTDFYFSSPQQRGYINRLEFRSGESALTTEDHPQYIEIVKVLLKEPLAPRDSVTITTPFHVKVPYNFDGIGYKRPQYDLKYWYPAVASSVQPFTVADASSNAKGDYNVTVILPSNFKLIVDDSAQTMQSVSFLNDSVKKTTFSFNNLQDFPLRIVVPYSVQTVKSKNASLFDSSFKSKVANILSRPLLPAIGYNEYDGFQLGVISQNYFQKDQPFNYYIAPTYTFKSKSVAGLAGASYHFQPQEVC